VLNAANKVTIYATMDKTKPPPRALANTPHICSGEFKQGIDQRKETKKPNALVRLFGIVAYLHL